MANMAWKGGIKRLLSPRDVRLLSKDNKNQGTYPSSFQRAWVSVGEFFSLSLSPEGRMDRDPSCLL